MKLKLLFALYALSLILTPSIAAEAASAEKTNKSRDEEAAEIKKLLWELMEKRHIVIETTVFRVNERSKTPGEFGDLFEYKNVTLQVRFDPLQAADSLNRIDLRGYYAFRAEFWRRAGANQEKWFGQKQSPLRSWKPWSDWSSSRFEGDFLAGAFVRQNGKLDLGWPKLPERAPAKIRAEELPEGTELKDALLNQEKEKARNAESEKEAILRGSNLNEVAVIMTSMGEVVIEFWPDVAPKTVVNFKTLAKRGFYDGTCFHRVIKGFMIQGGDPLSKDEGKAELWGTGGPGYKIEAEFNSRKHTIGVLSMARSEDPDSAGSQFFIMLGQAPHLDGKSTAYGKVIKGLDVLQRIGETAVIPLSRPATRINVDKIEIVEMDRTR